MKSNKNQFIKTEQQINIMRENGKILASMLIKLKSMVKPGISTMDLEKEFMDLCKKNGAIAACKGYAPYGMPPFPTGLCVSINNESVHCYPKKSKILQEGDVVTIDTSIVKNGLYVDSAVSTGVGSKISEKRKQLLESVEKSMYKAIELVKPGVPIGDISNKMHEIAKQYGFDVLRDYAGHGIGTKMHEWPEVACFGEKGTGPILQEGMTICIESLVCEGDPEVINTSAWETAMKDGKDWVQSEHTVLVTKDGYELLTAR